MTDDFNRTTCAMSKRKVLAVSKHQKKYNNNTLNAFIMFDILKNFATQGIENVKEGVEALIQFKKMLGLSAVLILAMQLFLCYIC